MTTAYHISNTFFHFFFFEKYHISNTLFNGVEFLNVKSSPSNEMLQTLDVKRSNLQFEVN